MESKAIKVFNRLCEAEVGKKYLMSKTYEVVTPKFDAKMLEWD